LIFQKGDLFYLFQTLKKEDSVLSRHRVLANNQRKRVYCSIIYCKVMEQKDKKFSQVLLFAS